MNDKAPADRLRSGDAWDEFCDALKSAGRVVLERSPDSDLDRAEGYRRLTRLLRMGQKLSLEYADPAAPELHRADHVYNLHEFGLEREKIRAELAPLFERFGWDEEGEKEGGARHGNV